MNVGLWSVVMFVIFALALTGIGIGLSLLLSPHHYPSAERNTTFECGVDTEGTAWVQFKVSYFMYALIFLLFDIETVFLIPFALVFKMAGPLPMIAVIVFLTILCIGLWYEWKEGALEWK